MILKEGDRHGYAGLDDFLMWRTMGNLLLFSVPIPKLSDIEKMPYSQKGYFFDHQIDFLGQAKENGIPKHTYNKPHRLQCGGIFTTFKRTGEEQEVHCPASSATGHAIAPNVAGFEPTLPMVSEKRHISRN
ncbi:hypothetical protein RB195_017582 [Necator americanus]|uniref:Uncharacterized protein n=1 Tax=Necator americanus TaxID=51031 RepID=A0ABR1C5V4_NECAM